MLAPLDLPDQAKQLLGRKQEEEAGGAGSGCARAFQADHPALGQDDLRSAFRVEERGCEAGEMRLMPDAEHGGGVGVACDALQKTANRELVAEPLHRLDRAGPAEGFRGDGRRLAGAGKGAREEMRRSKPHPSQRAGDAPVVATPFGSEGSEAVVGIALRVRVARVGMTDQDQPHTLPPNLDALARRTILSGRLFVNSGDRCRDSHVSLTTLVQVLASGALLGCFYTLMTLAFSMILGVSRSLNLAHGELVVLGGYLGYSLWSGWGLNPILLIPVCGAALLPLAFLWRWLLERLAEPRELNSLVLTFGLSLLLQNLMSALWRGDYRLIASGWFTGSVRLGGVSLNQGRILVAGAALAVVGALWLAFTRTRWGQAVRATSLDREAAALLGIDVDRATVTTFLLALALAGGSGVLFATLHYLYPAAGAELTLLAIVLTIWAGVGRLRSVLVAGVLLGVVESLTVAWTGPSWRELVVSMLLLGSLLVRSGGLARGWVH